MVRKNSIVSSSELKGLLEGEQDVLKELVRAVVQQTLEAEMDAALGAAKGERTEGRLGYRSGYYGRTLITFSHFRYKISCAHGKAFFCHTYSYAAPS